MFKDAILIKEAISQERAKITYDYFLLKEKVALRLMEDGYVPKDAVEWGMLNDGQVENAFSMYGDILGDRMLVDLLPMMEKKTKLKLVPTYSYTRVYQKGNELKKHTDRKSCHISTTLFLGGDPWSFYYKNNKKDIEVKFKPGDMLIYNGTQFTHWRKPFKGKQCVQIFLHYNIKDKNPLLYDTRPFLGLPGDYYATKNRIR
jgi:hypothetical protein